MNLLFSLPEILQENVFKFDSTYYEIYNLCMLELNLNFKQYSEINKMLRNFYKQRIIFRYYVDSEISELLD